MFQLENTLHQLKIKFFFYYYLFIIYYTKLFKFYKDKEFEAFEMQFGDDEKKQEGMIWFLNQWIDKMQDRMGLFQAALD